MPNRRPSYDRRVSRKTAFEALFGAFRSLTEGGSLRQRIEWLGEYPLLAIASPRETLHAFQSLCSPSLEDGDVSGAPDPMLSAIIGRDHDSIRRLLEGEHFVAFSYLESKTGSLTKRCETLSEQQQAIRELFREKYGSGLATVVRSDNLHSNGYNSIRESVTNLISADFFMSKGYMTQGDTGSGPDVIVFKTSLVNELRERRFIGTGASILELAAIRALGKVHETFKDGAAEDEVIAVESESVSPLKGIGQLGGGYGSRAFAYMGFFDRRVLAAPFLSQGAANLDILTYGPHGIEYRASGKTNPASDFWKSKKSAFIRALHDSMKATLLLNLDFEEISSMISRRPPTARQVLREMPTLKLEKILDKIESAI
ncbi:MAG: hypothetical protein WED04_10245 [Promethearchaeati archaeon SRVP18_Atabeyarchaeia-1]